LAVLFPIAAHAVQRFPQPDFDSGYQSPIIKLPAARPEIFQFLDVAVLLVALAVTSYLVLRKRSRRGIFLMTVFSLLYFGFWRHGCVCAVGSLQNVALAIVGTSYSIPLVVLAFFVLPLLFTLFFGRTFCAAVCPLGAAQELVIWRPLQIPLWLLHVLGMIPVIYLGLALLFAATGAGFIICQWDPFVGFFRFGGPFALMALGGVLLVLGTVIARPYCRFLCPYGVLLGWISRFSRRHATITPDECIKCRLCEDSCPVGAIRKPLAGHPPEARKRGTRRLTLVLLALPVAMAVAAAVGYRVAPPLANGHKTVRLARQIEAEEADLEIAGTLESLAFRASGQPVSELYAEASQIQQRFQVGTAIFGAGLALVFCLRIIGLSLWRQQEDYEPDRGTCLSCGRCFAYCPRSKAHAGSVRENESFSRTD
jgi:ferredoxin